MGKALDITSTYTALNVHPAHRDQVAACRTRP